MLAELNSFLLNEIINLILLLFLIVLFINALMDQEVYETDKDNCFHRFVMACMVYILALLVWLPVRAFTDNAILHTVISLLRTLTAVMAYSFACRWILSIAEERKEIRPHIRNIACYGAYVMYVAYVILYLITRSTLIAGIPILLYYLMLLAIVVYYRSALGKNYTILLLTLLIPMLFLTWQEWWDYTPANICLTLGIMIVYTRIWTVRKEDYLENKRLLAEQTAQLENARTKLVLSQIKPHFIYNTMSTITYLCTKKPQKARELSLDFTTYLRGNLAALDSSELIPFETELEHVKTYLRIESVRFEDTLKVAYDIRVTDFMIPVLSVEPLVENAVKHGVCQKDGGGTVTIISREYAEFYEVIVMDDGAGFNTDKYNKKDKEHVGMRSVRRRIESLTGGEMSIESSVGVGTIARLHFPKAMCKTGEQKVSDDTTAKSGQKGEKQA